MKKFFTLIALIFLMVLSVSGQIENNSIKSTNLSSQTLTNKSLTEVPVNNSPLQKFDDNSLESIPNVSIFTNGNSSNSYKNKTEEINNNNNNNNTGGTGPSDAVTVTPANLTINACSWPSNYFPLGNIVITEAGGGPGRSDFSIGTNVTIIFTAPANFEFQPGVGNVSALIGDITAMSIAVTNTTVTVTYTVGSVVSNDAMTISGLNVHALAASGAVNILYTGGTGVVAGLVPSVTVFGTFNSNLIAGGSTTWTGNTSTNWTVAGNWSAGVPTMCYDVTIPAGRPRYPILTTTQTPVCNNLTIDVGGSLTNSITTGSLNINGNLLINGTFTNSTTGVYNLYGNLTVNGTLNEAAATVYDNLRGSASTISVGAGATLTNVSLLLRSGSNYTLTGNVGEVNRFWILGGGTLSLSSFTLKTQNFFNQGTTSLNTGTLEVTDKYAATIGPDGSNPYFGGTMNRNTGTVMYSPRAGITDIQRVRSNFIYYNLTLNGRNNTTIEIGDGIVTHSYVTVNNDFRIINNTGVNMATGKIAMNLNLYGNFRVGGNCQIGSSVAAENNAVIVELTRPIVKTVAGTGFTMYNNTNHKINILWGHADSTAIYNYGSNLIFYGTVEYINSGTQKVIGNTYNNLTISSGGIRQLTANTTINGNLLINAGAFSATATNYNVDIKGDWTNKGSFDCRNASVFFIDKTVPTANVINGKAGTTGFVLQESFEGAAPGWWVNGYQPWPGTSWYLLGGLFYHGARCISAYGQTPLDVWVWSYSPTFNCIGQTNAWLTFYNCQSNLEHQILSVANNASLGAGATWVQVADYGTAAIAPWVKRTYDLGTYVSLTSDMGLRWSGWHHTNGSYCAVDCVTVWVKPPSAMDDFYNLTMNRSLGVTVDNSINIRNNLIMTNGNFRFSSPIDYLEIGYNTANRGSLNYTSGIVVGRVKRWFTTATNSGLSTGMFPFGTAANFCPAQIEYTGAPTTGGSLMGRFITTLPADYYSGLPIWDGGQKIDNLADEGLWQLDAADGLAGGTYTCTLRGTNFATVTIPNNVRLLKRPSAGGNWTFSGAHGSGTFPPLIVSRTGMSGFSQFALGGLYSENNILPISLLRFDLNCNNDQVKIAWATASETNNDYYTIERSADGVHYYKLADIKAAGNSNSLKSYSYTDKDNTSGTLYYRLKQTNYDGNSTYIAAKFTNCASLQSDPQLVLYPNPFNDFVTFDFKNLTDESLNIIICDVLGKHILDKKIGNITSNNASFTFDLSQLAKGVYSYNVYSGNSVKTGKIVKYQD